MTQSRIILYGDPVPQARVRIYKRGNKVMSFDPQASLKRELKVQVKSQLKDWKFMQYPRVNFWFMMPIPKSMAKADRVEAMTGYKKHIKKPDVDNLIKLYLDVLSGIAFEDDNCVSLGQAIKVYGQIPKVVIHLEETERNVNTNEILREPVCGYR